MHPELLSRLKPITDEEARLLATNGLLERELYMNTNADIVHAEKLLDNGKLITIRPHTRFVHFPEHTHDYVEVVYMCSGQTTHIVNGTPIVLKTGELLFFGQGARQEILPAGEDDIAVNFIILPQFFDKALEMLGESETPLRRFIVASLSNDQRNSNYLYFQVADVYPIQNLMENLLWTLIIDQPNKRNLNQTTMGLLFMHLLNHTDRLVYEHADEAAIVQILRYIETNYASASLSALARDLHYDLYWLSREIKQRTGRTYKELLQEKRLSQAAYLLLNTNLSVDEIGLAVGYSNLSYFHRIFKQTYQMSPKKFRDHTVQ